MSETTPTYYDFVKKLFNRTGDLSKDFSHAILGIVTEVHELRTASDEVNAHEEQGDLGFFLVALGQVIEDVTGGTSHLDTLSQSSEYDKGWENNGLDDITKSLLDDAKRWVGYGKQPADLSDTFFRAATAIALAESLSPHTTRDIGKLKAMNMAKLLKRYPGGEFDSFRAVVRDLEAERAVLEAH